jgi:hypothetical protein
MNRYLREVVDGPVSDIPLSLRQYGMLAVAEFSMYFQDLPPFEPKIPGDRPILDTHVGTWVEHADHQDGYAMMWTTRPQDEKPSLFQVDCQFIKTSRDPDNLCIVGKAKPFEIYSHHSTSLSGERLSQEFDKDELLLIQNIVRKNQNFRHETEVPMDKFVIAALFSKQRGFKRPGSRRRR